MFNRSNVEEDPSENCVTRDGQRWLYAYNVETPEQLPQSDGLSNRGKKFKPLLLKCGDIDNLLIIRMSFTMTFFLLGHTIYPCLEVDEQGGGGGGGSDYDVYVVLSQISLVEVLSLFLHRFP